MLGQEDIGQLLIVITLLAAVDYALKGGAT